VIVGDLVLFCDETRIFAFDLLSGRPAWGTSDGVVFEDEAPPRTATARRRVKIGLPHYTMTAHNGLLLARMGEPTTSWAIDSGQHARAGYLVCLDLSADGRLLWKIRPDGPSWSFEGSPLADDANVYVAMRRSDVRPEAHVACFDAATGHRRWRRFICAADTPAQGQADELTHNLLTLAEGTIYYNTNLGAVASLARRNGTIRWLRRYRRVDRGDLAEPAANFRRGLNPCLYAHGRIFVAPSDSQPIFSLAAGTGRLLWSNPLPDDVTDLLGVGGGHLIASGQRLWWFDTERGTVVWRWPESKRSGLEPRGRGALIGTNVYWPCADSIRVLPFRPTTATREMEEPLRLDRLGVEPGNLVATEGHLLIAGCTRLYGLTDTWRPPATPQHEITGPRDAADRNPSRGATRPPRRNVADTDNRHHKDLQTEMLWGGGGSNGTTLTPNDHE
jgi:outer membrane protein assembly factor BamB